MAFFRGIAMAWIWSEALTRTAATDGTCEGGPKNASGCIQDDGSLDEEAFMQAHLLKKRVSRSIIAEGEGQSANALDWNYTAWNASEGEWEQHMKDVIGAPALGFAGAGYCQGTGLVSVSFSYNITGSVCMQSCLDATECVAASLSNYSLIRTYGLVQATWNCQLYSGSLTGLTVGSPSAQNVGVSACYARINRMAVLHHATSCTTCGINVCSGWAMDVPQVENIFGAVGTELGAAGAPCAANHNTYWRGPVCCNQPGPLDDLSYACNASAPFCLNYVYNQHWGTCSASNWGCANVTASTTWVRSSTSGAIYLVESVGYHVMREASFTGTNSYGDYSNFGLMSFIGSGYLAGSSSYVGTMTINQCAEKCAQETSCVAVNVDNPVMPMPLCQSHGDVYTPEAWNEWEKTASHGRRRSVRYTCAIEDLVWAPATLAVLTGNYTMTCQLVKQWSDFSPFSMPPLDYKKLLATDNIKAFKAQRFVYGKAQPNAVLHYAPECNVCGIDVCAPSLWAMNLPAIFRLFGAIGESTSEWGCDNVTGSASSWVRDSTSGSIYAVQVTDTSSIPTPASVCSCQNFKGMSGSFTCSDQSVNFCPSGLICSSRHAFLKTQADLVCSNKTQCFCGGSSLNFLGKYQREYYCSKNWVEPSVWHACPEGEHCRAGASFSPHEAASACSPKPQCACIPPTVNFDEASDSIIQSNFSNQYFCEGEASNSACPSGQVCYSLAQRAEPQNASTLCSAPPGPCSCLKPGSSPKFVCADGSAGYMSRWNCSFEDEFILYSTVASNVTKMYNYGNQSKGDRWTATVTVFYLEVEMLGRGDAGLPQLYARTALIDTKPQSQGLGLLEAERGGMNPLKWLKQKLLPQNTQIIPEDSMLEQMQALELGSCIEEQKSSSVYVFRKRAAEAIQSDEFPWDMGWVKDAVLLYREQYEIMVQFRGKEVVWEEYGEVEDFIENRVVEKWEHMDMCNKNMQHTATLTCVPVDLKFMQTISNKTLGHMDFGIRDEIVDCINVRGPLGIVMTFGLFSELELWYSLKLGQQLKISNLPTMPDKAGIHAGEVVGVTMLVTTFAAALVVSAEVLIAAAIVVTSAILAALEIGLCCLCIV